MSETLRLELVDTGETLRLLDPQTGKFLPTYGEILAERQQAEARAEVEAEARRLAESELARLREE
ncbi:MAG: Uma2 family endonuclease, partial [Blastocatellia bacterium]